MRLRLLREVGVGEKIRFLFYLHSWEEGLCSDSSEFPTSLARVGRFSQLCVPLRWAGRRVGNYFEAGFSLLSEVGGMAVLCTMDDLCQANLPLTEACEVALKTTAVRTERPASGGISHALFLQPSYRTSLPVMNVSLWHRLITAVRSQHTSTA